MTLAEYLAEVKKRVEQADKAFRLCEAIGAAPPGINTISDVKLLLAIIEEQAKALEHFKTLDGHGWRVAGEAQTRIDALIAKGEK